MAACHEPGTVLGARNAEESLISSVEPQTDPGTKKVLCAAPNAKLWMGLLGNYHQLVHFCIQATG